MIKLPSQVPLSHLGVFNVFGTLLLSEHDARSITVAAIMHMATPSALLLFIVISALLYNIPYYIWC